jgi:pyruvate dehydrogenase E1 component
VAPEASSALGLISEDRRDVGLLAVTSANQLYAGWTEAQRARARPCSLALAH